MSYCRFSSNNWDCDVYVYAHCDGGYVINVAMYRRIGDVPCPALKWSEDQESFMASYIAQEDWRNESRLVPIGLPHDGEDFSFDTAEETADKLEELQAIGYHVPGSVVETLREEAKNVDQDD